MDTDFTYYAFISYSHKDSAFAQRLQHYLEHYKLPSVLCRKYPHIPRQLRPIFRDGSDLAIGQLSETLREALAASRYLIVICSENSVRPNVDGKNWIDEEIRMFLELHQETGGAQRVIPIILREKGGLSDTECLLPAIRELDILAADILTKGESRAFNDVAAKMAGLKPDTLWDRFQREQRRQRRLRRLAAGMAAALTAAAAWFCWDYYVPHEYYYTDYIERDNLPEGLFPLTKEEMQKRRLHYRFTYRNYRLRTVEHCTPAGRLQDHEEFWDKERPASMELAYGDSGRVNRCIHRDAQGREIMMCKYSPNSVEFKRRIPTSKKPIEVAHAPTLSVATGQTSTHAAPNTVSRFHLLHESVGDAEGVVTRELYCEAGRLVSKKDGNGIAGREYGLDELGRTTSVRYLSVAPNVVLAEDTEVETFETPGGIAGYRLSYGPQGRITSVTCVNKAGALALNEEQWAQLCITYDANGNASSFSYFGADGKPCLLRNNYARKEWKYDERGNLTEASYYGVDGKPCLHRKGYARKAWQYNERGLHTAVEFYGADGKLCSHHGGYSRCVWQYDEHGHKTETAYYDAEGQLCANQAGISRILSKHDHRGNAVELAYYDAQGKPCLCKDGYARITWEYNKHGDMFRQSYYGVDGNPCLNTNYRSRITGTYDERGDMVEETNFSADMALGLRGDAAEAAAPPGHALVTFSYDDRGHKTAQAYYGVDGQPCLHADGYSRLAWSHNSETDADEVAFYGVDGQPVNTRLGFHRVSWQYDRRGNITNLTLYDAAGTVLPTPAP